MKQMILFMILIILCFLNNGCRYVAIDAGEEGVLTHRPILFGEEGVNENAVSTGAVWVMLTTSLTKYDIKPVKITEKFVDLTASDNVAIDFNTYLTLQIKKGTTPVLHEFMGKKWYKNNIQDVFRTIVRNQGRVRSSIDLRTNPAIINTCQDEIFIQINNYVKKNKMPVEIKKIIIGKVIPPNEVLLESERTAAQKQKTKTEIVRAKTELARKQAEINKALADKAYTDEFNMTTKQFLKNKELDILSQAVKKGNVSIIMNASNSIPMFNAIN